jgi:UDP-galactopyranose mutase
MKKYDYLIIGTGISGSTIARLLTDSGKKVLMLEAREQVGGNIATRMIDDIPVHFSRQMIEEQSDDIKFTPEFYKYREKLLKLINSQR